MNQNSNDNNPPALDNRRDVLKRSLLLASAATAFPLVGNAFQASAAPAPLAPEIEPNQVILFQGDSITDAHRDRKRAGANDPAALGNGYPMFAAGGILASHPSANLKVYNRGISGNKVPDLDNRWEKDCIDLKPNVVSILIGVNDIWHKMAGRYDGTVETYRDGYAALIERTQKALPDTRIVVCEPFVLRCGAVKDDWFPEFDQRREAALEVADRFKLTVVPFQTMFDEAIKTTEPAYWAADGVHPTIAGHALMATKWREVVGI
ncbi:GDSL-like Lipase/Acylhydrolase [Roseimaritima multifibrata]|uniref:GDSL-like Lipase/Acylhydrolase n=1 Tax=Roseimaritima multifibrata TaxID=1930274 RepID=A0A517MK37_9BACT|nr:SGNH/GDSL hydrolase family protein [Roseimaritima multifibrata]QDS95261.1 GDSL-like Lipase/Acylhydrolase [Roseimaritima multifibrata]